jgi:hypothetical protein
MFKSMSVLRSFGLAAVLGLAACGGLGGASSSLEQGVDDSAAPQVCTPGQPDARACDPADAKKTTVCHIPPGNPANEHTICIGNAGVPAHLAHGDHLGSCCGDVVDGGGSSDADGGTAGPGGAGGGGAGGGGGGDVGGVPIL